MKMLANIWRDWFNVSLLLPVADRKYTFVPQINLNVRTSSVVDVAFNCAFFMLNDVHIRRTRLLLSPVRLHKHTDHPHRKRQRRTLCDRNGRRCNIARYEYYVDRPWRRKKPISFSCLIAFISVVQSNKYETLRIITIRSLYRNAEKQSDSNNLFIRTSKWTTFHVLLR